MQRCGQQCYVIHFITSTEPFVDILPNTHHFYMSDFRRKILSSHCSISLTDKMNIFAFLSIQFYARLLSMKICISLWHAYLTDTHIKFHFNGQTNRGKKNIQYFRYPNCAFCYFRFLFLPFYGSVAFISNKTVNKFKRNSSFHSLSLLDDLNETANFRTHNNSNDNEK